MTTGIGSTEPPLRPALLQQCHVRLHNVLDAPGVVHPLTPAPRLVAQRSDRADREATALFWPPDYGGMNCASSGGAT